MDYCNIDEFLSFSQETLANKRCILFLGPRFGKTAEGKTAGETIHEKLAALPVRPGQTSLIDKLDDEFDNLFILKDKDAGTQAYQLKGHLARFYKEMEPGDIYKTIARLPFGAVICCTPDLMLKKAYDNLKESQKDLDVFFYYYSPKGSENKPVEDLKILENKPAEEPSQQKEKEKETRILYNLFGSAENPESLIVTYEAFFKFVVDILGTSEQLPGTLQYIFQGAEIFMMLGFDLNKWYIPLIIRKLNQGKGAVTSERSSVLTLDTTFRPEAENKLSTTFIVVENQTEEVLERISMAITDQTPPPQAGPETIKPDPVEIKGILDAAQELVQKTDLPQAVQTLLNDSEKLQLSKELKNSLRLLMLAVLNAQRDFATQQISYNDMSSVLSRSAAELLRILDELRGRQSG